MKDKLQNLALIILLVIALGGAFYIVHYFQNISVGKEAVETMYTFNNYSDLKYMNMPKLKKITTDKVYNQLSYDNFGNAINNYLQFVNKPTGVKIISSKHGCVTFEFINQYVPENVEHQFVYTTNIFGNINSAKEITKDALCTSNS